jgi:hypothetical protein
VARPIPLDAPVTTMTLSAIRMTTDTRGLFVETWATETLREELCVDRNVIRWNSNGSTAASRIPSEA